MRKAVFLTLAAGLATASTGCLGGTTEIVPVAGTYLLQSVNNSALPFTFSNGTVVSSEIIILKEDGSFTDDVIRSDGTKTDTGAYTNYAGTLIMADATIGLVYQAKVEGSIMTITVGQYTERFQRN